MKIVWTGPPQYHPALKLKLVTGQAYDVPESIAIGEEELVEYRTRIDPQTGDPMRDPETDEVVRVEVRREIVRRGWLYQGVARLAAPDRSAPPPADVEEKATDTE